ncbi:endonuclease V-like protein UPF0215 family [Paenibacillus phyllosphaerae]|uniref:Endonuclease V-like protein UPF0215 family n=1 Tax=Paenibacillus phyllosphaerae TaxID=274593 RepID=A0A7W5B5N8_9BACL|nr:hypothetical protein [Paenibacillus phyllosphaerae]MBB3114737.1 endonuclease V-like protein UPF0215 family [Paenibacillus phyllosphaerae]
MAQERQPYKLYMSCSWYFDSAYNDLHTLLEQADNFSYQIEGVALQLARSTVYQGRQRYELIREQMKECDAMLLLAGVYPSFFDWISKEIVACKNEYQLPIIAVMRDDHRILSPVVRQAADQIIDWNATRIITAIQQLTAST